MSVVLKFCILATPVYPNSAETLLNVALTSANRERRKMERTRNILNSLSLVRTADGVLILSRCSAVVGHFEVRTGGATVFHLRLLTVADSHSKDN